MHQNFIFAYIMVAALMINGYAQDLQVNIVPTSSQFTAKQAVEVDLNYENKGAKTVLIYKWYLPNEQLYDPLFEVTLNGKRVEYVGPIVKRRPPTVDSMITLEPGKSLKARVQLSTVYNMTESGKYAVQFKLNIGPMLTASARLLKTEGSPSDEISESILVSPSVGFVAEGRPNLLIDKSIQVNSQVKSITYGYTGCSTSQKNTIMAAVKSAAVYSSNAIQYLAKFSSPALPRYTTWFGTYSSSNLATLKKHYANINSVFNTKAMSFDCTCTMEDTYAFVYPYVPYKIHLCPVYWTSSSTGTDTQGGTLVHETSHFQVVAGTLDHAYGQSACQSLAKKSPTQAVNNADSHQYFAENHPVLK